MVRRGNKFETPDARDKVPIVSIVDDSNVTSGRPKKPVFPISNQIKKVNFDVVKYSVYSP
jgi:hypothetical protein